MKNLYYVAIRQRVETDALSCLLRHGCARETAEYQIAQAKALRSPVVMADVDEGRLIISPYDGQLWSFLGLHLGKYVFDDEADALELAAGMVEEYPQDTFAVFSGELSPTLKGRPQ